MKPILKLTKFILAEMRADIARPHTFAFERVGCIFTKLVNAGTNHPVILTTRYKPVPDEMYVNDQTIGARIGSAAIRMTMQEILDRKEGAFLVHSHDHVGVPMLSITDLEEMLPLVPSLRNVEPEAAHGAILLSDDSIAGWVLLPRQNRLMKIAKVTVVGFPLSIFLNRP